MQAATMAEIAREAGISPGAIYRYFESKDVLVHTCLEEGTRFIMDQWRAEEPTESERLGLTDLCDATVAILEDPSERLHTILWLEELLAAARDEDRLMDRGFGPDGHPAGIAARLRLAQAEGELSSGVDADTLAWLFQVIYDGLRIEKLYEPDLELSPMIDLVLRLIALVPPADSTNGHATS